MGKKLLCVFAVGACLFVSSTALADPVLGDGTYRLNNHPDGNARPPLYGLRLDGLGGLNGIFTFDFEASGASMLMDLTVDETTPSNSQIHIYGTVFGGLNSGAGYAGAGVGLWDVDFTYGLTDGSNIQVAGDGRTFVQPENNAQNNGTITPLFTDGTFTNGTAIDLVDFRNPPTGEVFILRTGHRGFPGVSGYGWVTHGTDPNAHVYSSDWLFTVSPERIPAPGAAVLAMMGFGVVGAINRRRS